METGVGGEEHAGASAVGSLKFGKVIVQESPSWRIPV